MVEPARSNGEPVYDLQVEGTSCFFADGILVHNCLIIDDPYGLREDAESDVIRDKTWRSFTSNSFSRLAPHRIVIVMGTRWHIDDFHGRIKALMASNPQFPRYQVIHFKARQDDGTYLFPERYNEQWYLDAFGTLTEYESASLLQNEPVLEGGNMIKTGRIEKVDTMPDDLLWVRSWDLASTEKERAKDDPDWTAGVRLAVRLDETGAPTLYIADMRRCQDEAPKRDKLIRATAGEDGPGVWIGVESVAGYKDAYTTLAKSLEGKAIVHKIVVNRDPVVRVADIEPMFEHGRVFMRRAGWNDALIHELGAFPKGTHDDQVHAIANGYLLALERARAGSTFGGQVGQGAVG